MNNEEKAVASVLEHYGKAANASNLDAVVALYTDDGVLLAQETPSAVGRDAVRSAYAGIFAAVKLDIAFTIAEVRILSSEWAFSRSTSRGTLKSAANGVTVPEANQELFLFQKIAGDWKIARYAFSVTSQAPTS